MSRKTPSDLQSDAFFEMTRVYIDQTKSPEELRVLADEIADLIARLKIDKECRKMVLLKNAYRRKSESFKK